MPQYTIVVFWPQGRESVFVDTEAPPEKGTRIRTFEKWPGYEHPTEYDAEVVGCKSQKSFLELTLSYRPELNTSGQARENESWGVSTLKVDLVNEAATAGWTEVGHSGPPIPCRAQLINEALHEDLGHEWYKRRVRKQAQFRKAVLRYGARCALSSCTLVEALDAAHIIDVDSRGGFQASNGIMLRADLHRLYDRGALLILQDGSVAWSEELAIPEEYLEASKSWKLHPDELRRVSKALARRWSSAAA